MIAAPDAMAADPSAAAAVVAVAVAHSAAARVVDPVVPDGVPVDLAADRAVPAASVVPVVPAPARRETWAVAPLAETPAAVP
jgi:hypothetical protein